MIPALIPQCNFKFNCVEILGLVTNVIAHLVANDTTAYFSFSVASASIGQIINRASPQNFTTSPLKCSTTLKILVKKRLKNIKIR